MYVCGRAGFASCGLQTFLKNRNLVWILFLFFFTFFGIMKIQNKKNTSKNIRWWLDNGWKGKDVLVAQLKTWKIRNLSLCSKLIEHCHLVQNFPPVPEMLLKIQSDPSPLGYSVFQVFLENTQFEFMEKNI